MTKQDKLLLALVLVLALLLRLYRLTSQSLWLDEMTSLEVAGGSFFNILAGKGFDRHTPPFYYLVLHVWLLAFPANEWGLRLFSVFCDMGAAALIYAGFSLQFDRRAGLGAAAFYAVSPFAVYYAQEGRMYSLLMLLAAAVYYLCLLHLRGRLNRRAMAAAVLLSACGAYTHYYFILFLISLTVGVLVISRHNLRRAGAWVAMMCLSAVLFVPWIQVVAGLAASGGQPFRRFVFLVLPYTFLRFTAGYAVMPLNYGSKDDVMQTVTSAWHLPVLFILIFAALCTYGLGKLLRRQGAQAALLLSPLVLPAAAALLVSLKAPMLSERYLVVSFPAFAGLLGFALSAAARSRAGRAAALAAALLCAVGLERSYYSPEFGKAQWREAAVYLTSSGRTAKTVLLNPPFIKGVLGFYLPPGFVLHGTAALTPDSLAALAQAAQNEFWLVEAGSEKSIKSYFPGPPWEFVSERIFPLETGIRVFYLKRTVRDGAAAAER